MQLHLKDEVIPILSLVSLVICQPLLTTRSEAVVFRYTSQASWNMATGNDFTAIGFTGFPDSTLITTQYSELGVTFLQPPPFAYLNPDFIDGAGIGSFPGQSFIRMTFSTPMNWFAIRFRGALEIFLYSQDQLVYTSDPFDYGFSPFAGLVSDGSFDKVVVHGHTIDDLVFGPSIPAPGPLALLTLAILGRGTRRRE